MKITDWIAIIALVISSGGLFIQIRNWFASKPRLFLSVMPEALSIPDDGRGTRIVLTVTNRGGAPTMLTHMVAFTYENWWRRWRNKPNGSFIVKADSIPARVEPFGIWVGQAIYTNELRQKMKEGKLYVGVKGSRSDKIYRARVLAGPDKQKETPV